MTDIDLTNYPDKWRVGDRAEFTFNGVPGHGGPLSNFSLGQRLRWHVANTWIDTGQVTDLRVTRPAPTLPEKDGAVIQWGEGPDLRTAEFYKDSWSIAGDGDNNHTTSEILRLIKAVGPYRVAVFHDPEDI